MIFRRRTGIGALAFAGCLAAGSARAVPITLYDHVELRADPLVARERIAPASESADAIVDVALKVAPNPPDLSIAPLAISFYRWDDQRIGMVNGAVAPVAPDF